jgi:hypothetical protein
MAIYIVGAVQDYNETQIIRKQADSSLNYAIGAKKSLAAGFGRLKQHNVPR